MASRIKLSYHNRLFLLLLAFSWTMIACFVVFQYYREKQCKSEVLNAELQIYNQHLLKVVDEGADFVHYIETHEQPWEDLRITLIDFSGKVVYDNTLSPDSLDNHLGRPEIAHAIKHGSGQNISRHSASNGCLYFYSATKGERCIVRSAIPYSATLHELLEADWAFLWAIFLLSLLMSVLAYFATRRIGKTIERLNQFAAKAERGEAFDETESFPHDELGAISDHIVKLYAHKRQLTNNINHELKTPVASIQACLETLLSGIELSEEKRQELLGHCYANTERLRRLLSDVSLITRMEDGSQLIDCEEVAVDEMLNMIAEELEALPDDQRMKLHLDIKEPIVVYGNPSLLNSIFSNLTENALTHSGGQNIYISLLSHERGFYRISFEDDGCGVDEEKLPRLFERFYRVDKGRSRQRGGTGLGLSIVKHAVLFHNGTISVSNRSTGGLKFEFTLPDVSARKE
ncbi:MAG: HAMP domain-containing histidine kinase [Bacteroidales bacterium]|nr:HAMP domain-containing histidine kinase [Bacteroidales bacterium]